MSTRSTISVVHNDDSVSQVYCHFDGYLDYNGDILMKHYKNLADVEELVSFGDMSSLGTRIHPKDEYHFDKRQENVCVFYGRDRGEDHTEARKFVNVSDFYKNFQNEEYNYLFRGDMWYVQSDGLFPVFTSLAEAIEVQSEEESV